MLRHNVAAFRGCGFIFASKHGMYHGQAIVDVLNNRKELLETCFKEEGILAKGYNVNDVILMASFGYNCIWIQSQ